MDKNKLVLLIQEDPADSGLIRQVLEQAADSPFRLQCVERWPTALARVAGGGVDVVLMGLSHGGAEGQRLDNILKLRQEAPGTPIVVFCAAQDESFALKAMRAGAADYVIKERCANSLRRVLNSAMDLGRGQAERDGVQETHTGRIIALMGAKGGTGTTTVALNVASALAQRHKVILVEMRAEFGTLAHYFQPPERTRNLSHLLEVEPVAIGAMEAATCLWHTESIPGLRVLFGPQTAAECGEISPGHAKAIPKALAGAADYVVVDLPALLSDTNRAVVENSGLVALVVERDPVCVQSAKLMTRAIEAWSAAPRPIGMVIVNRAFLGFPMSLPQIELELGRPALGVIPLEPDLCLSAQNARTPLVAFLPESPMAGSLIALADRLAPARTRQFGSAS